MHCEGRAAALTLMTQRRGEDGQRGPHRDSAAALAASRPTLSAAQPPAFSHLTAKPSHHPSAAQPSATQPSVAQPPAAQPSAAQPSAAKPTVAQPPAAQLAAARPSTISSPANEPSPQLPQKTKNPQECQDILAKFAGSLLLCCLFFPISTGRVK